MVTGGNTGDNRGKQRTYGQSNNRSEGRPYQKRTDSTGENRYSRNNNNNTSRYSSENREYKPRTDSDNRGYRSREDGSSRPYQPREGNGNRDYGNKRPFNPNGNARKSGGFYNKDKDNDGEYEPVKYNRVKPPTKDKNKELQTEKVELTNRFEKEKKVVSKKKSENTKKVKSNTAKQATRVKRTGNIDWTKEYENDSYDTDDTYYDY